jgi:hypothetical protein
MVTSDTDEPMIVVDDLIPPIDAEFSARTLRLAQSEWDHTSGAPFRVTRFARQALVPMLLTTAVTGRAAQTVQDARGLFGAEAVERK